MKQNQSAHQLIQNKDGLFLNSYDTGHSPAFEWVADPSGAWVFHPANRKGRDTLLIVKLNEDSEAKFIDRAEAIRQFNAK